MSPIFLILLIIAMLCFLATAFGFGNNKVNLLAFGLFCWVLVDVIQLLQRLL